MTNEKSKIKQSSGKTRTIVRFCSMVSLTPLENLRRGQGCKGWGDRRSAARSDTWQAACRAAWRPWTPQQQGRKPSFSLSMELTLPSTSYLAVMCHQIGTLFATTTTIIVYWCSAPGSPTKRRHKISWRVGWGATSLSSVNFPSPNKSKISRKKSSNLWINIFQKDNTNCKRHVYRMSFW